MTRAEKTDILCRYSGDSFSGRTAVSKTANVGSIPTSPATRKLDAIGRLVFLLTKEYVGIERVAVRQAPIQQNRNADERATPDNESMSDGESTRTKFLHPPHEDFFAKRKGRPEERPECQRIGPYISQVWDEPEGEMAVAPQSLRCVPPTLASEEAERPHPFVRFRFVDDGILHKRE